jgi:hypothetical protein
MKLKNFDNYDELEEAFEKSKFDEMDVFVEFIVDCWLEENDFIEEGTVDDTYDLGDEDGEEN